MKLYLNSCVAYVDGNGNEHIGFVHGINKDGSYTIRKAKMTVIHYNITPEQIKFKLNDIANIETRREYHQMAYGNKKLPEEY